MNGNTCASGATIGVDDNTNTPAVDGEVPVSCPTIFQQCDLFVGDPTQVDLIIGWRNQ